MKYIAVWILGSVPLAALPIPIFATCQNANHMASARSL